MARRMSLVSVPSTITVTRRTRRDWSSGIGVGVGIGVGEGVGVGFGVAVGDGLGVGSGVTVALGGAPLQALSRTPHSSAAVTGARDRRCIGG
jgi:hypothetical protein